ncbi:MAG: selenium-dependent molybdenum cofactor biosynthesis protein YqeB [Candidatus Euphemobacter frigidus]|nr:selenium-dependent molybdenum cofactor biosynthesis protein YqeB [Candidatus Euphemobacter frigidus]MDP8276676.1 selenium-dependent molybdenum cofactor biosynthesis protein YqeB [Candidatus Euphemobacter frigidus]
MNKKDKNRSGAIVVIRGGGEVASGIAHILYRNHLRVCLTEITNPLAVSRGTSFSEAVFDGVKTIEGVTAELVSVSPEEISRVWRQGNIAIVIDPEASVKEEIKPDVLVDATMAKQNVGTGITDAHLVIGMGPGFYAGRDVHIVVETNHSNNLGRAILKGEAERDTGTPVAIGGLTKERVIWAPQKGIFTTNRHIGDSVVAHQVLGRIGDRPLPAPVSGILRGLMRDGVMVPRNAKLVEVDPINDKDVCYVIRDKMRAIAGGILEAIMLKLDVGD